MKMHHALTLAAVPAMAKDYPAELAGHVILPAATFVPPPADAPADSAPISSAPISTAR